MTAVSNFNITAYEALSGIVKVYPVVVIEYYISIFSHLTHYLFFNFYHLLDENIHTVFTPV